MKYAVGLDFGTESARAALVDLASGAEVANAVHAYANAVIEERLPAPNDDVLLDPDWALQDPDDYLAALRAMVPRVLAETGIDPADVIGVGVDFTSSTILPTTANGTALCRLPELRREPHAWVKLWKHHAAQPEADRINGTAAALGESWLPRYGGRTSSEWLFAKSLQILDEAPDVYRAAERIIEGGDWLVWQLTGVETRSSCAAGYKALWSKADGFPRGEFFAALDPRFAAVVDDKLSRDVRPIGDRAGELTAEAAGWTGLRAGTPVAIANVDAHASVPAVGVTAPGTLVAVMGTSTCHMALGSTLARAEGVAGVVEDGIIPGFFGYEAGQAAVGDLFAWFSRYAVPPDLHDRARREGTSVHAVLEREAAALRPGGSGLLALDWWNGNRSVLVDAELSGLLVGMTLATRPAEIYRALLEATVFGTRVVIDSLVAARVPVDRIVACGGLPERNPLLMQLTADITGREVDVAASRQASALGAAMFGAVAAGAAAGGFASIGEAAAAMVQPHARTYRPDPATKREYDELFADYLALHDEFGRGGNDVMRRLRARRARPATGTA